MLCYKSILFLLLILQSIQNEAYGSEVRSDAKIHRGVQRKIFKGYLLLILKKFAERFALLYNSN